ncbi:similar to Saccharomyces cerevisiae YGR029W ERV1 Flavin-linked sulfhydryl oxidase of the mitochondrial intermembrane space (IMS) [Maudiozyma saulgeensis]|uniref:Sulfhydryl oxidase n=1 Tax=Maudiozyma saulgeensis TaxID=1789683 RepID=A0A1X7RBN8_9SACH|nr:similar to Saccharomyces cerevisiae YGR029W ERV1 Flavin-linked sulfhydryl oxidase of the mitochondrial intermembrane space (IMS) [Kazachstania saulgeensis]
MLNPGERVEIGPSGRKIIYDADGKPCRSCNEFNDFQFVTGKVKNAAAGVTTRLATVSSDDLIPGSRTYTKVPPPDVNQLGRSSWTMLHAMAAKYPKDTPTNTQKEEMTNFLKIFSHVYPCTWCAKDFEKYIRENAPKVDNREQLGRWMCEAHNHVNKKLGKPKFNCNFWEKRWVTGWDDE